VAVYKEYINRDAGSIVRTGPIDGFPKPIPPGIHGWMWSWELRWLYVRALNEALPGTLLEIGSYKGLSASALGQAGPLTCIDTFQGGHEMPEGDSRAEFDRNMRLMGLKPRVLVGDSAKMLEELLHEKAYFRLIFVDGSHQYDGVRSDLELSWALLSRGGTLVADDYFGHAGVKTAVDEFGGFQPVSDASKMAYRVKE
jgi:predicted O-methyltransferase YrrM